MAIRYYVDQQCDTKNWIPQKGLLKKTKIVYPSTVKSAKIVKLFCWKFSFSMGRTFGSDIPHKPSTPSLGFIKASPYNLSNY